MNNINTYRFRHTFCTNALGSVVGIKTARLMLGDNTVEMVLRVYTNINEDDIFIGCMEVIKVVDNILKTIKFTDVVILVSIIFCL